MIRYQKLTEEQLDTFIQMRINQLREEGATVVNPNTSKRKVQKGEKQKTLEEANKWENANRPKKAGEEDPSRVGDRPYARGRAYVADRFGPNAPAETAGEQPDAPAPAEEIPEGTNSIAEGEISSESKSEIMENKDAESD